MESPEGGPATWLDQSALESVAQKMAAKGWEAVWHPAAAPEMAAFRREVRL